MGIPANQNKMKRVRAKIRDKKKETVHPTSRKPHKGGLGKKGYPGGLKTRKGGPGKRGIETNNCVQHDRLRFG
jgi:hypothetical protein